MCVFQNADGKTEDFSAEEMPSSCRDVTLAQNSRRRIFKIETEKLILKLIWKENTMRIGETMRVRRAAWACCPLTSDCYRAIVTGIGIYSSTQK